MVTSPKICASALGMPCMIIPRYSEQSIMLSRRKIIQIPGELHSTGICPKKGGDRNHLSSGAPSLTMLSPASEYGPGRLVETFCSRFVSIRATSTVHREQGHTRCDFLTVFLRGWVANLWNEPHMISHNVWATSCSHQLGFKDNYYSTSYSQGHIPQLSQTNIPQF